MPGSWPNIELWPIAGKQPGLGANADGWSKTTIEVDIMESPETDRSVAHSTIHYGANNSHVGGSSEVDVTLDHIYVVE